MQTYNYKCNNCGKNFEIQATLEEKETKTFPCLHCKSKNTKSQFSMSNFLKNIFGKNEKKPCCSDDSCCDASSKENDSKKCC